MRKRSAQVSGNGAFAFVWGGFVVKEETSRLEGTAAALDVADGPRLPAERRRELLALYESLPVCSEPAEACQRPDGDRSVNE